MESLNVKDIAELSMSGLALVGLWQLWTRLNLLTDRLFVYLENAKVERHELRNKVQTLQTSTDVLSERAKNGT